MPRKDPELAMTFKEIGEKLGISTACAAVTFNRAMKKLQASPLAKELEAAYVERFDSYSLRELPLRITEL